MICARLRLPLMKENNLDRLQTQCTNAIRSYLLEEGVLDGDVSEGDVFVEGARLADAVDVVQRVEPRPHDAAGAVGWEIIVDD